MPLKIAPNLAQQLAKCSWLAPLLAFVLSFLSQTTSNPRSIGSASVEQQSARAVAMVVGAVNLALIMFGLVAAVIALARMGKYGRTGVLAPAIVGLCLNLLLIAAVVAFVVMVALA